MKDSKETLTDMVSEIKDRRFSSGYHCAHYYSDKMVRYGHYRKRRRYLCRSYRKIFTDLVSTALNYIHDKEKFVYAVKLMLSGATLEKNAKRTGISIPTAFSWRHKVLGIMGLVTYALI